MVPEPMISTPFSAWIFRMENIRSCLRIVDAPSTPISSAIATRSAGVFFFNSFRCIEGLLLGICARARQNLVKSRERQDAANGNAHRQFKELAGAAAIGGMSR